MKLVADPPDDRRGLSPVVGIILLFGMVLMGATLVAIGGMSLIDTMQTESSLDQAETSMQQVGSDLRDLSYSADENQTSVETSDGARLTDDAKVTLTVNDNPDRSATVTLGSLQYEADSGETVTLEGDGVFRSTSNGSYVVSPPALTLRDGRLSFPVTKLNGSVDGGDSLTATKNASARSLGDELLGSGLAPAENVTITVESAHYDAWGRYLAKQAGEDPADVIDHDDESATVTYALGTERIIWAEDASPGADTKHHVRYTIEEGSGLAGDSIETITIDYPFGSVNAESFEDPGNQIDEIGIDEDGDGTIDENIPPGAVVSVDGVSVDDAGSTITISLRQNPSNPPLEAGDQLVLSYDKDASITNPDSSGSYDTTVSLNGVEKSGSLVIDSDDSDDIDNSDQECIDAVGDDCGTVEEDEDANAIEVNQDEARLTFVGSEIAQEIDENEVERKPLDVVFTLDRSGSMDYPYYSIGYFTPLTETMTVEEAIDEGYITESRREFRDRGRGRYTSSYDYKVTEGGQMPFVRQDDGSWVSMRDYLDRDEYDSNYGRDGQRLHFNVDPDTEIQIRESGFDPNEKRIDATESFLDAMNASAGDRAAITDFNMEATTHTGLTTPGNAEDELVAYANGGTSITSGIENAIDEFDEGSDREKVVVLLTDGENSYAEDDYYTAQAAQRAAAQNITIHVVGLGDADRQLLEDEVAEPTGGEFYYTDEADELEELFDQIAGETIQERTNQIEYQSVTSAVQVGGESYTLTPDGGLSDSSPDRNGTNVNNPSSEPPTYNIDDIDLGSLVSANVAAYDCEESEPTGETVTHNGEEYEKTRCIEASEQRDQVDNSVSDHRIYTDGEELDEFDDLAWYQNGPEALLENYDGSLIEDGEFTLSESQAVIVVELDGEGSGTDYAMMLLEVDEPETETPSDDSSLIDAPVDEIELEG